MPFSSRTLAFFVLTALMAAGCSTTPPLEVRALPFHVAIVPMEHATVGRAMPGELPGEETRLRLDLTSDEVTQAVSTALGTYCFSRVTVLDPEDSTGTVDAFARDRRLLERAREAQVDLLVELDLRYDPEIYRENSSTFWLNWPLFLFAGPSHWFLGDNDYFADVELTTTVYDMNVIEAGGFSIGDPAARVLSASARYTGGDLAFTERTDGIGDYALGIFVPSGYLSRESESAAHGVHARVLEELRSQVVQGIQSRRSDLVQAEWIAPVYIDPADVRLTREGNDLVVRGTVRLRRDSLVDRVQALLVEAGGETVVVRPEPDPRASSSSHEGLPFLARVPFGARATEVRIECEAGSRDRYVRSYTFPIPFELPLETVER